MFHKKAKNDHTHLTLLQRDEEIKAPPECPLDKDLLGRNTWSFLHTMAAYFPENPTLDQSHSMASFFTILSDFYPCHYCAEDLKTE